MILYMMIILCSILFLMLNHPLSCGLILLLQTILTAMISSNFMFNAWFSYILFLIMVGGMLVLFMYMTSIASNEKFKFNSIILIMLMLMIMLIILFIKIDFFYFNNMLLNSDMLKQNFLYNNKINLMKYMNFPNYLLMMTIIMYLFITLIAIVKITKSIYGPLRQKF